MAIDKQARRLPSGAVVTWVCLHRLITVYCYEMIPRRFRKPADFGRRMDRAKRRDLLQPLPPASDRVGQSAGPWLEHVRNVFPR
jgi:hypothetical protein